MTVTVTFFFSSLSYTSVVPTTLPEILGGLTEVVAGGFASGSLPLGLDSEFPQPTKNKVSRMVVSIMNLILVFITSLLS